MERAEGVRAGPAAEMDAAARQDLGRLASAVWRALADDTLEAPLQDANAALDVLEAALTQSAQGLEVQNARIIAAREIVKRIAAGPVRELERLYEDVRTAEAFVDDVDASLDEVERHVVAAERKAGIPQMQNSSLPAPSPQAWFERFAAAPPWKRASTPSPPTSDALEDSKSLLPWTEINRPLDLLHKAKASLSSPASASASAS